MKLTRFGGGMSKFAGKAKDFSSKDAVKGLGGDLLEVGGHAAIALFTKNAPPSLPVKPDAAVAGLSLVGMLIGKGSTRKLAKRTMKAALHAMTTRFVSTGSFSVVSGPDGFRVVEQAA